VYIRKNSLKNALDATKRTEINTKKEWVNTVEKVKDTFQTALEEEANHRYIHAKMDREEAQLN